MSKKTHQRKQREQAKTQNGAMRMKLNFVVAHTTTGDVPFFGLLEIQLAGALAGDCDPILAHLPTHVRLAHTEGHLTLLNADTEAPIFTSPAITPMDVFDAFRQTIRMTHHWFIRLLAPPPYATPWHTDFIVNRNKTFGPMPIAPEYVLRDLATPMEVLERRYKDVSGVGDTYVPWLKALTGMINGSVLAPAPLALKRLNGAPGLHVVLDGNKFGDGERTWKQLFSNSFTIPPVTLPAGDDRTTHEHVVTNFLETIHSVQRWCQHADKPSTSYNPDPDGGLSPSRTELHRLQQLLNDARVFELTVDDDCRLIAHAEKYLKRALKIPADTRIRDAEGITDALATLATQVDLPLPLPFKVMYIGLGEGNKHGREHWPLSGEMARTGWLISDDGYVFNFDLILEEGMNSWLICPTVLRRPSGWTAALKLPGTLGFHDIAPWIIRILVEALKDFRTTHVSHGVPKELQPRCDRIAKEVHRPPIPPLFYQVTMQDLVIDDARRKLPRLKIPVEWTYRWTVTGHERRLIRYGQQPLDEDTRADLIGRKYTIYEDPATVPPEVIAHLRKRHLPQLVPGQWLAYHEVWIAPDVRPHREDLPFIPSVRVPGTKLGHDE